MKARHILNCLTATVIIGSPLAAQAPGMGDVRINDDHVFPESLSADRHGRLYIGSVKGTLFRTAPNGDVAEPWIRATPENGILSILGVVVDDRRKTLWLCSASMSIRVPPAPGVSSLMAFDLATGTLKATYPFPAPASACNDIAIAQDGKLFVTDTPNGRIFTLKPGGEALELFAQDAMLKGIDGIAFSGSGRLYVNNVRSNQMFRVDRNADGSYKGLTTLILSQPIKGPDGLRLWKGERFLQAEGSGGRVTEVRITGDKADIRSLREGLDSSPAITIARGRAYAAEGKIGYLVSPELKGQDPGPFYVRAIPLPR